MARSFLSMLGGCAISKRRRGVSNFGASKSSDSESSGCSGSA